MNQVPDSREISGPSRADPAHWPDWLRITLIVISGFWVITIPFMFWKRMRYSALPYVGAVSGSMTVLLILIGITFGESSPEDEQAAAVITATPTAGNTISVGSLDLTVHKIQRYKSTAHNMFNTSNLRVEITAHNARGDEDSEYNISAFYFKMVDENGIAHDADWVCTGCPDVVSDVDLVRGGHVRGFVYFAVPENRRLVELIYEPLFSTNKARFRISQ